MLYFRYGKSESLGGLPSLLREGLPPPNIRKEGLPMYVIYADVIRLLLKLLEFFVDWEKIKNISNQKVIDIDVYKPWLNSKLQELDVLI